MVVTWVVVGVIVVVAAGLAGFLLLRRRVGGDSLSRLVADALASEWASRTGLDLELVRNAILRGGPDNVYSELAALVADVEVAFEYDGPDRVGATVECRYKDGASVTTVTLKVPWERVPQPVREQFLRVGTKHASRHWSIPQPA